MGEEFDESEVVFSDIYKKPISHSYYSTNNQLGNTKKPKQRQQTRGGGHGLGGQSPPLDIPTTARYSHEIEYDDFYYDDDDNDNDEDEDEDLRVPPHVIVARRINNYYNVSRKMACSFCIEDEKGRILKGRNLCEVRNSILRLTGFYET